MISETSGDSYFDICQKIREHGRSTLGGNGYSRIVFTNGCFDVIHLGHIKLLNECRRLAGHRGAVVVGVNSSESVSRLKGPTRPIFGDLERCTLLVNLKSVDHVVTFDEDTPYELIVNLRPDLIIKGGDYRESEVVGHDISPVHIVDLYAGQSTTSIIERMKR